MHSFSLLSAVLLLSPALQALVAGSPLLAGRAPACNVDNPFLDRVQYANSGYAAKLEQTISSFLAAGDTLNAAKTRTVQGVSTFLWISSFADVSISISFETRRIFYSICNSCNYLYTNQRAQITPFTKHLDEAIRTQRLPPNKKLIVPFVIYNLPDRDCSAKASDGELSIENDGINKYKQFIDQIAAEINKPPFDRLDFAVVLEPDSLGNSVTNTESAPKCKIAAPGYLTGLSYAVKKLQQKNVALYIDAAHSNWLGWPGNLEPCKTASSSWLFFSTG